MVDVDFARLLDGQKLAATPTNNMAYGFVFDLGGEVAIGTDPATDPHEAIWTLRPRARDGEGILTPARCAGR